MYVSYLSAHLCSTILQTIYKYFLYWFIYIYRYIYVCLYAYIYEKYKQEQYHWKKLCASSFEKSTLFYFYIKHKKTTYNFLQSTYKQKIVFYTNIEATGWLFKMASLVGACRFKLHGIFILFYQIFVVTCLQKKVLFLFHFVIKNDVVMTSPLYYDKTKQ